MMSSTPGRYSRRQVLKLAGVAGGLVTAPALVRAATLGKDDSVAASERITLGFIGIGRMGQGHLRTFLGYPEVQVLAVCDVDQWRRENARAAVEKAYASTGPSGRYRGCTAHRDFRELLAREDIDAVVIATGDHWHVPVGVRAVQARKDVYCEKPLSLTIREARAMVEATRRNERVFQTGLQQRSTPDFRRACELVQKGRIGAVKFVYVSFPGTSADVKLPAEPVPEGLDWDLWLGPAPRRPFNGRFHHYGQPQRVVPWDFCRDFGGGNLTSNAVHAFDVVQWALGMDGSGPVEIIPPETGEVPSLTYRYGDGVVLQVDWKLDRDKHFVPEGWDVETAIQSFGALFVGEDGWIHVGRHGYLRSFPAEIVERGSEGADKSRPIPDHHHDWLQCIRNRKRPACDVAIGCGSTIVSHLGCIAHWTRRKLKWDPAEERFAGDEEANRLRRREKRDPWSI